MEWWDYCTDRRTPEEARACVKKFWDSFQYRQPWVLLHKVPIVFIKKRRRTYAENTALYTILKPQIKRINGVEKLINRKLVRVERVKEVKERRRIRKKQRLREKKLAYDMTLPQYSGGTPGRVQRSRTSHNPFSDYNQRKPGPENETWNKWPMEIGWVFLTTETFRAKVPHWIICKNRWLRIVGWIYHHDILCVEVRAWTASEKKFLIEYDRFVSLVDWANIDKSGEVRYD